MLFAPWVLVACGALGLAVAHVLRRADASPPAAFEIACWLSMAAGFCLWGS